MQNIHEDSTIVSSDDMLESVVGIDPLNSRLPTKPPLEPYEGMKFASIEETRIYYTRYAKNTGFSFRMGRVTKSRTNGPSKIRSVLCTESGGVDNVRFSPQDVINYLTEKRQKKLENGDA
ncbi:unnamed protein product [Lathyrus oleraceus]